MPLNLFNISCIFSGGITISATFHEFSSSTGFGFTIFSTILFPINFPVVSAVLLTAFLEAVFAASSPVFVAVSNNSFLYFSDRLLSNDKNLYSIS